MDRDHRCNGSIFEARRGGCIDAPLDRTRSDATRSFGQMLQPDEDEDDAKGGGGGGAEG